MSTLPDHHTTGPLQSYWRYRWITVPLTLALGVLLGATALLRSKDVIATSTVYLTDPRGSNVFRVGSSGVADLQRYALQRAQLAVSKPVLARAAEISGFSASDLDSAVSSAPVAADMQLDCSFATADDAIKACDAVVQAYEETTLADVNRQADEGTKALLEQRQRVLADATLPAADSAASQIDLRIADIQSVRAFFGAGVEFVSGPDTATPSRVVPAVQYGVAGLLFGALAATAIAWTRANRRTLIRSSAGAESVLGAPLLGTVLLTKSRKARPISVGTHDQAVLTGLQAVGGRGVIIATSAEASGDQAAIVARLAAAAVQGGSRVLLIDGEFRSRRLTRILNVSARAPGLLEYLAGAEQPSIVQANVGTTPVDFLPLGLHDASAAALLRTGKAQETLDELSRHYDIVFIDAAPVLDATDGGTMLRLGGAALVFVGTDTAVDQLEDAKRRLNTLRVPMVGFVFLSQD